MSAASTEPAATPAVKRGSPIQIVNFRTIPGIPSQLVLEKANLRSILTAVGNRPLYVLSIAGASRQGKSFLLTIILYLLERLSSESADGWKDVVQIQELNGFHFANGTERQTVGLWMWSTPFIFRKIDGTEIAVLLMDSQGVFDEHTNKRAWSMLVGLNLLTSSCMIYNLFNNLQEDNLEIFHNFVEFGMLAATTDHLNGTGGSTAFQKLIFMIRDWMFPNTHDYGQLGGSTFLEDKLKIKDTMPDELKMVRQTLKSCFEETNCFLLPNPGELTKSTDFKGPLSALKSEFVTNLNEFVENLLVIEDMKPKMIGGQTILGMDLLSYFDKYITAFNAQTLPKPVTLMEATIDAKLETVAMACISKYTEKMESVFEDGGLINPKNLKTQHEIHFRNAVAEFMANVKTTNKKQLDKHLGVMSQELTRLYHTYSQQSEENRSKLLNELLQTAMVKYETLVNIQVTNKTCLREELQDILQTAKEDVIRELGDESGHKDGQFFMLALPKLEDLLLQMDEQYTALNTQKLEKTEFEYQKTVAKLAEEYKNLMNIAASNNDKMTMEKMQQTHLDCEAIIMDRFNSVLVFDNPKVADVAINQLKSEIIKRLTNFANRAQTAKQNALEQAENQLIMVVNTYLEFMMKFVEGGRSESEILTQHSLQSLTASNRLMTTIYQICNSEEANSLQLKFDAKIQDAYSAVLDNVSFRKSNFKKLWQSEVDILVQEYEATLASSFSGPKLLPEDELTCNHDRATAIVLEKIGQLKWLPQIDQTKFRDEINTLIQNIFLANMQSYRTNVEQAEMEAQTIIKDQVQKYVVKIQQITARENISLSQVMEAHTNQKEHCILQIQDYSQILPPTIFDKLAISLESELDARFREIRGRLEIQLGGKRSEAYEKITDCVKMYGIEMDSFKISTQNPTLQQLNKMHETAQLKIENQMDNMFFKYLDVIDMSDIKKQFGEIVDRELEIRKAEARSNEEQVNHAIERLRQDVLKNYHADVSRQIVSAKSDRDISMIHKDAFIKTSQAFEASFPSHNNFTKFQQEKQILERELEKAFGDVVKQFQEISSQFDVATRQKVYAIVDELNSEMENLVSAYTYLPESKLIEIHGKFQRTGLQQLEALEKPPSVNPQIYIELLDDLLLSKLDFQLRQNETNKAVVEEEVSELVVQLKSRFMKNISQDPAIEEHIGSLKNECIREFRDAVQEKYNLVDNDCLNALCGSKMLDALNEAYDEWRAIEPNEAELEVGIRRAAEAYHKEMLAKTSTSNHVHAKILKGFHHQSAKAVTAEFIKAVKQTDTVKAKFELVLNSAFQKYADDNDIRIAEMVNPAIGIDLGTTYSCVCVHRNGKTEIVPDATNHANISASYILYQSQDNIVVGNMAKEMANIYPERTIFDAKRLIGRRFNDPKTVQDMALWPFEVINDAGFPKIKVDGATYLPEEVSAELLKKLRRDAEKYLDCTVENVVITVPAYFNDAQKVATRNAGAAAGLNVLGLLNEPTSAAIAYSLNYTDGKQRNVLVYDLGGGTFDVSILSIQGGEIVTKGVKGNNHLGGEDFDDRMVKFCIAKFEEEHKVSLSRNATRAEKNTRLRRIRDKCEKAKITLSVSKVAPVICELIFGQLCLTIDVTREEFDAMNADLFQETIQIVADALEDAKMNKDQIDDVVLVGGSTRIPRVQELLKAFFNGKPLNSTLNADEVVAHGAALYAAMKNGTRERELGHIKFSDVAPLSLGINAIVNNVDGSFSKIIHKNTPVPASETVPYYTVYHHQTEMDIEVFEGEDDKVANNNLLGKFTLKGIPPRRAGIEKVDVTMSCDSEGILTVKAVSTSTGSNHKITIECNR